MLYDGNITAARFQKFIDHRGVVRNFPWGALARLGLARAYAMAILHHAEIAVALAILASLFAAQKHRQHAS